MELEGSTTLERHTFARHAFERSLYSDLLRSNVILVRYYFSAMENRCRQSILSFILCVGGWSYYRDYERISKLVIHWITSSKDLVFQKMDL
jgi:hypothetical protein